MQSPDAVFVQVLDSLQVGDKHQVQFKVTNHTLHGVYIESAVLAEPGGDSTFTETHKVPADITFGDSHATPPPQPAVFPKLLASSGGWLFDVEFPFGDNDRKMMPDSAGKLKLMISRLDQSKSEKKEVTFLIRLNDTEI